MVVAHAERLSDKATQASVPSLLRTRSRYGRLPVFKEVVTTTGAPSERMKLVQTRDNKMSHYQFLTWTSRIRDYSIILEGTNIVLGI